MAAHCTAMYGDREQCACELCLAREEHLLFDSTCHNLVKESQKGEERKRMKLLVAQFVSWQRYLSNVEGSMKIPLLGDDGNVSTCTWADNVFTQVQNERNERKQVLPDPSKEIETLKSNLRKAYADLIDERETIKQLRQTTKELQETRMQSEGKGNIIFCEDIASLEKDDHEDETMYMKCVSLTVHKERETTLSLQIQQHKKTIVELKQELITSSNTRENIKKKTSAAKKDLREAKQELQDKANHISYLEKNLEDKVEVMIPFLRNEVQRLIKTSAQNKVWLEETRENITYLQDEIEHKNFDIEDLTSDLHNRDLLADKMVQKYEGLEASLLKKEQELSEALRENQCLRKDYKDECSQWGHLEKLLTSSFDLETMEGMYHIQSTLFQLAQDVTREITTRHDAHLSRLTKTLHIQMEEGRTCIICNERGRNQLIRPCNHLVTCTDCSHSLRECPICRTEIATYVRVFQ